MKEMERNNHIFFCMCVLRWSISLFLSLHFLNLNPSPLFIQSCPSVICHRFTFHFWRLKKKKKKLGFSVVGSVGSVCPNTLGLLMITCPQTCQGT